MVTDALIKQEKQQLPRLHLGITLWNMLLQFVTMVADRKTPCQLYWKHLIDTKDCICANLQVSKLTLVYCQQLVLSH